VDQRAAREGRVAALSMGVDSRVIVAISEETGDYIVVIRPVSPQASNYTRLYQPISAPAGILPFCTRNKTHMKIQHWFYIEW